ncbi:MAG TPA: hypothetical protein VEI83_12675 [Acidimicrobiales bacterium]|nr:hypothetical protein [Acidimicrobiales bacterium]
MPAELTELTEIVTALGTLPHPEPELAIAARPAELVNVEEHHWARLAATIADPAHAAPLQRAWLNGRALLEAGDGLRGRHPARVEWKGPQQPPGYDLLPADLRIDHVYLVSCKYMSKILMNASPGHVFDRSLAVRDASERTDWYEEVAPDAYAAFYDAVRQHVGCGLPARQRDLDRTHRTRIAAACKRRWPDALTEAATTFSVAVSDASAARWRGALGTPRDQEHMVWRLLRLNSAPYFVLGTSPAASLRLRIGTPWDWRQLYRFRSFEIAPRPGLQPAVDWIARVETREGRDIRAVRGHIEIRWSHGRFCGVPEAKIYLDTPHELVPGYFALR